MMLRQRFLILLLRILMATCSLSVEQSPIPFQTPFFQQDNTCSKASLSNDRGDYLDVGEDLGLEQNLEIDEDYWDEIQDVLHDARIYLQQFNFSNPKFRSLREKCKNRHELCALWAVKGECRNNPRFMNTTCAPMCQSCEFLLHEFRCPVDPNAVNAWYPGDMNRMFERITTDSAFAKYKPRILSGPYAPSHGNDASKQPSGPWIVQLESFLSDADADRLIELGINKGFQQSFTSLGSRPDGSLDSYAHGSRTSSSTYCDSKSCLLNPTTQAVTQRIEKLTSISGNHFEHFHMLRYEEGQLFNTHSDYLYQHRNTQEGVRMLSVLMYLNDAEEGGHTRFPHLNIFLWRRKRGVLLFGRRY